MIRDHDHVEFSFHGDSPVKYAENSSPGENSPPKIGHSGIHFMITPTFRLAHG